MSDTSSEPVANAPVGKTARGVPIWEECPPREWLRDHETFAVVADVPPLIGADDETTVRLTFRKRYASKRKSKQSRSPSWNAHLYKKGQRMDVKYYDTITVYAGTSDTLPERGLPSVIKRFEGRINKQRISNSEIESGERKPTRHSPKARKRRPYLQKRKPMPKTDKL